MNESDGRRRIGRASVHCVVIDLHELGERLLEDVVACGVDERVQTEVDEAECAEHVKPLTRQHSTLSSHTRSSNGVIDRKQNKYPM